MEFIKVTDSQPAVQALVDRLQWELLSGKSVLWFLSGGSNIAVAVKTMENISDNLSENLTIMLIDERFGPVDHKDSNWSQLLDAEIDFKSAKTIRALQPSETLEEAAKRYNQEVGDAFTSTQTSIALMGMGPDGHVSGILPGSPATKETDDLVVGYKSEPYERLTTTFPALKNISATYLLAFGDNKKPQLDALQSKQLPLDKQPAQILKQLSEVYVYNDQIGEPA